MSFLENLNWRFATKIFDPERKVSNKELKKILKAIRLAPTSFGLQPFHVFVVSDRTLKDKLKPVSFSQPQVSDSSHLLVFCARTDVKKRIAEYIELTRVNGEKNEDRLKARQQMLLAALAEKSNEQILAWAQNQVYIALGFALAACAELKIDSCPMGGFEPKKVDKVLQLPPYMKSTVYLAIGFRAEEPKRAKLRFVDNDLFTFK